MNVTDATDLTDNETCYPTRAYDLLEEVERQAVDDYVNYIVNQQRAKRERIAGALNLPIPNEYIRRSRRALYKPVVRAAIAERILEESEREDISPDRVIKEHALIAFSDATDFLTQGYQGELILKDLSDIPAEKTSAIKTVETKAGPYGLSYKLTMHDKLPALKALAEMMGITAPDKPPVLVNYVKQELKQLDTNKSAEAVEVEYTELLESINSASQTNRMG